MSDQDFNKKEKLDTIYELVFGYFIAILEDPSEAKSTDVKAAHDFLVAHNYDFRMNSEEQEEVNAERARLALADISEEDIIAFSQTGT